MSYGDFLVFPAWWDSMDVYIYIYIIYIYKYILYTHVGVSWRFYSKILTKQTFWNMVPIGDGNLLDKGSRLKRWTG